LALDVANSIADIIYRLGFLNATDLDAAGTWVTSTELYQWADEAAQLLAYRSGAFVTVDTSITAIGGTAVYTLPASNVFTLAAWLGSTNLRLTPVRELSALDATWSTTSGASTRASLDAGSVGTITLYPKPTSGGTLTQIAAEAPATINLATSTVALPTVFQDMFSYAALAGARGKESEGAQPEMAEHYQGRVDLYLAIADFLFGPGA
jgi:hypothetical protein